MYTLIFLMTLNSWKFGHPDSLATHNVVVQNIKNYQICHTMGKEIAEMTESTSRGADFSWRFKCIDQNTGKEVTK